MSITTEDKRELISILRQEMEQEQQRRIANKALYRRICANLSQELSAFNYDRPYTYWNGQDRQIHSGIETVPCACRIETALSSLLRIVYQVDSTTKLPADKELEIQTFMENVLNLMGALKLKNEKQS